jgi:hypothetical protein
LTWNHKATINKFLTWRFCKAAKSVLNHPDAKVLQYNVQDAKIMATHKHTVQSHLTVLNVVGSHDTQSCRKPRHILCSESYPPNYKGCTVYRDLINSRNKANPKRIKNTPQQATNCVRQCMSYSQVASENLANQQTNNNTADISGQFTIFHNEFKNMFNQVLNQNTMVLTMLTTVINN